MTTVQYAETLGISGRFEFFNENVISTLVRIYNRSMRYTVFALNSI